MNTQALTAQLRAIPWAEIASKGATLLGHAATVFGAAATFYQALPREQKTAVKATALIAGAVLMPARTVGGRAITLAGLLGGLSKLL